MNRRTLAVIVVTALVAVVIGGYAIQRVARGVFERAVASVELRLEEGATTSAQKRELPTGRQVVYPAIPTALPMIGDDGVDKAGYPRRVPDAVGLIGLLRARKFAKLNAHLEHWQEQFESDYRNEYWPVDGFAAFATGDPQFGVFFSDWANEYPEHFAPYLARAHFLVSLGWLHRGSKFAQDVHESDWKAFRNLQTQAHRDARRALELRPRLVAAHGLLIDIKKASGTGDRSVHKLLDQATKECPECFRVREAYIAAIEPRWGGSFAEMNAFAEKVTQEHQNPKLRLLRAVAPAEECRNALRDEREQDALLACNEARRHGLYSFSSLQTARVLKSLKKHDEAIAELDRIIAARPNFTVALVLRAHITARRKRAYEPAVGDLLRALRMEPTDEYAGRRTRWLAKKLIKRGKEATEAARHDDALKLYSLAVQLRPDRGPRKQRFHAEQRVAGGDPIGRLRAAIGEDPDDFFLVQRLDDQLLRAGRVAEILPVWNAYIALNPSEPYAYLERSGTHRHLADPAKSRADLVSGCGLGLRVACDRLAHVTPAAGVIGNPAPNPAPKAN